MVYIRKHSALLALGVLLAYFYIAQTSIENKHTHFYANGVVITHSHPVSHENGGDPAQNHGHNKTEICFFSTIHFDFYEITKCLSIDFEKEESAPEILIRDEQIQYAAICLNEIPRGPPVYVVC